jgi:FtsP/CotA-like multicopper oxidase with cupredoxin domain
MTMEFPTQDNYPAFPVFLADIRSEDIRISRRLDFGWEPGRTAPVKGDGAAPQFTIDRAQFQGHRYDQTMVLGDAEEWMLTNATTRIAHPFHIHVNPFQVVEIYDPNSSPPFQPAGNYIWHDVIAIPPAKITDGRVERGYVRIRHRFVDFAGSFVLHCHMLAHEDRGMMQLVRVIPPEAPIIRH